MSRRRKAPCAEDVARWVALLARPIPDYYGGAALSEARKERRNATEKLSSWDLDASGNAKVTK